MASVTIDSATLDTDIVPESGTTPLILDSQRSAGNRPPHIDSLRSTGNRPNNDSQRSTDNRPNNDSQRSAGNRPNNDSQDDSRDNGHESDDSPEVSADFVKQTITGLVEKYGTDLVMSQSEEAITGSRKRKRVYKSKSSNYTDIVRLRLKDLELSCRVSFFINMNNSQAQYLFEYFMADFEGPRDIRVWLTDIAKLRINQNLNTWKFRSIDNLIAHVRVLNKENPEFKRAKNKMVAASLLEQKFNLESFVTIFDFVKGWIDLQGSAKSVRKYCKLLYVELVAYAKMHTIWLDDPKRMDASEYSRRGLSHRLTTCTSSSRWAKYIPEKDDIKLVTQTRSYARKKKKIDQFKAPDEDDEFYVLDDSDNPSGNDGDQADNDDTFDDF